MPECDTKYFGRLSYSEDARVEFVNGLPGFADRRGFLTIDDPGHRPLIFLQSLEESGLCFLTLPVDAVDSGYQLKMNAEDLAAVGLEKAPAIGAGALCVAVVVLDEAGGPAANLLAPIVVNCRNHRAVQAVRDDCVYGSSHPLPTAGRVLPCS